MRPFLVSLLSTLVVASDVIDIPSDIPKRVLKPDIYGYSIEPSSAAPYIKNNLTSNLMTAIAKIIGVPASIRVGGNIADQTLFEAGLKSSSVAVPNDTVVDTFRIRKDWFRGWGEYFPLETKFIYTLNLRNESGSWMNAMKEAEAAIDVLGASLSRFELGNEIDHYINKGWRKPGWGTKEYTQQWHRLTRQILSSASYKNAKHKPHFQAAVFADPPWVPDQHDEVDDFDIINVTRAGLVDPKIIDSYAVHLYPQSTCDAARESRLSLNLLSNHEVVWKNLSQFIPQEAAARNAGSPLVLGETNSASCSGRSGISDTFGAALWATDYVLTAASIGIEEVYFHLGHQSEYSAITPLRYKYEGEQLTAGVRANFYSHLFLAFVVAGNSGQSQKISALPAANTSDFSGYAVFSGSKESDLEKLVFIDLAVWNSTKGLHNPSTLSSTDSDAVSSGHRPQRNGIVECEILRAEAVLIQKA
ncbi:hypothetical protein NUU61_006945 [Penicillium alfredii]|uniref:Beta-glucuronidase C-terminal domain-containing protein n=1 Tax=Penicillium alfredii TaxID=1506179 RepID=A0A9W9F1W5_9EURO|nr:uncharacterized protein NUU61_006945 [Penicillium alfredii]KAJ5092075.1 hypothetical protein NUU61_006945 [Penicillium alfredii]